MILSAPGINYDKYNPENKFSGCARIPLTLRLVRGVRMCGYPINENNFQKDMVINMIKNPFAGKSTRTKMFTLITAAAVLLVIVLNLLLFAIGVFNTGYLDLTPEGVYTVRDIMYETCDDIFYIDKENGILRETPVKFTFCADPDVLLANYAMRPIYTMALELRNRYPNVEVECVNVAYNPTAVADYKTTSLTEIEADDIIVSYGSRYRITPALGFWHLLSDNSYYSFDGEYKLAMILLSLTLINRPKAYFINDYGCAYYDEENPESDMSKSVGSFVDLLNERGLEVKYLSIKDIIEAADEHNAANPDNIIAPKIPDDCALLILNNPKEDLFYDETRANSFNYVSESEIIDRFLTDKRGSLMVSKGFENTLPNLEALLREWGIDYSNTLVKDPDNAVKGENDSPDLPADGTNIVSIYNTDEEGYAASVFGEFISLDSAPRTIVSNSGYLNCSFGEAELMREPGTENVTRIFSPLLLSSSTSQAYSKNTTTGEYVDVATGKGQKVLAAVTGRQVLDGHTNKNEYSYVFCAASSDFFSNKLLGNASYANYDIVAAIAQNISRLDTHASIELGGLSANAYTGFGGKVLVSTVLTEGDVFIKEFTQEGEVIDSGVVNYAFLTKHKVIFSCIIFAVPLIIAAVGIVVKIKRKYL